MTHLLNRILREIARGNNFDRQGGSTFHWREIWIDILKMICSNKRYVGISDRVKAEPEIHFFNHSAKVMVSNKLRQFHGDALSDQVVSQGGGWFHQKLPFVEFIDNSLSLRQLFVIFIRQFGCGTHGHSSWQVCDYFETTYHVKREIEMRESDCRSQF